MHQAPTALIVPATNPEPPSRPPGTSDTARWARIATLFGIAVVVAVITLQFLSLTAHSLALIFIAIVIGEALSPITTRLARFMPTGVAVALVFLMLIGATVGLGIILQPQIADQTSAFTDALPGYIDRASQFLNDLPLTGENDVWSSIQSNFGTLATSLISVPVAIFTSLAQVVVVAFMAAYWIISRRGIREFLESLMSVGSKHTMRNLLAELSATVGGYVRGTGIGALVVGTTVFIGLSIMGVQFPLIMAIFAAFGELIPILGPNLAAIPAVFVAFLDSWKLALAVAVFYLVLQQIESAVLVPMIMDNQANIPPLLVIVSVSIGGAIAGILGAIIAIPAAGALRVIVVKVIAPAIRRWSGADSGPLAGA